MTDYTTNLNLELIDFNKATWHDDAWNNYKIIDAACAVLGLSIKGLWANSTAVVVGEFWVDGTDGSIWQVNVAHTTAASPTTFSSDRTSNPTYWSQINAVGQWRGVWAATTYYAKNDIVYNSDTYYQCHTAHTSGGSFSATNWTTLVDLSSSVTAAQAAQTAAETAQTAAETAQTAAETAQTAAETAETNAETAKTGAETAQSAAETAETNAETAQTAAEAAQSAAETAQTAAETAQTGAETAETGAETALETFQATFLGAAASAPTVDGNGNPLTGGEIYLNTGDLLVYIYNLGTTTWIPVGQATSPVVGGGTGDGSTTSFALGSSPSSENHVLAYINGQYVPHSEFSVSSGNIVFATAPVSGDEIDWLVLQATDIGTPSDDTVGPDQLDDTQIPEIRGFLDLDLLRGYNYIINGDFEIAQRGTSQTVRGYESLDRWDTQVDSATAYSFTAQQSNFGVGGSAAGIELQNYYRCDIATAGTAAGDYCFLQQPIENVRRLSGKTITLTFLLRTEFGDPVTIEFYQNFGTGGSPSSSVFFYPTTRKITPSAANTWEKVTLTVDVPSVSGKTLGSNANDFLAVVFWFGAGSDFNSRTDTLGHQSGNFDIAHVSIVQGDATDEDDPFSPRHFGQELELCKRYYQKFTELRAYLGSTTGTARSELIVTELRDAPTISYTAGTGTGVQVLMQGNNKIILAGTVAGSAPDTRIAATAISFDAEL